MGARTARALWGDAAPTGAVLGLGAVCTFTEVTCFACRSVGPASAQASPAPGPAPLLSGRRGGEATR